MQFHEKKFHCRSNFGFINKQKNGGGGGGEKNLSTGEHVLFSWETGLNVTHIFNDLFKTKSQFGTSYELPYAII